MSRNFLWRKRHTILAAAAASLLILLLSASRFSGEVHAPKEGPEPPSALRLADAAGVPGSWWSEVQGRIAEAEYEFHAVDEGLGAPNRAQDLRVLATASGLGVAPRGDDGVRWNWRWRTSAWGREDALRSTDEVAPGAEASRLEYRHDGFVEWYENRAEGLEQGFTIAAAPRGEGRLCIEGEVAGGLNARLDGDDAIEFLDDEGALLLRYDHLLAWDAEGRELPSEMALADGAVRLFVDDAAAVYPVVVDPILTTPNWEWSTEENYSYTGCAVSTAGDVNGDGYSDVLVGAYSLSNYVGNAGAAFCFLGGPGGVDVDYDWVERGQFVNAFYGNALSTAGDVNGDGYDDVIVGGENTPTASGTGVVEIYLGSADGLENTPFWSIESELLYSYLGSSVSYAGDVNGDGYDDVIVGEDNWGEDWPDINMGRVHVYGGGAGTMTLLATRTGGCANAHAGLFVCGAGDVDADGYDDVAYCEAENCPAEDVRVLYGDATGSMTRDDLIHEPGGGINGNPLAAAGDVNGDGYADLLVGAPSAYSGTDYGEGWAYCYLGSASGIETTAAWIREGGQAGAYFASSVATAGDVNGDGYADVIIGAKNWTNGDAEEGKAFVFLGSETGLDTETVWGREGNQVEAHFGSSVATAGDVNGDGLSDLIVGADHYDEGGYFDNGRAFVYLGGAYGPKETAGWYALSGQADAAAGFALAGGGDVNGDGYSDVLVSAPWYDYGQTDEGVVWLFTGGPLGLSFAPAWFAQGDEAEARFGASVDFAGDVNGDGYDDVLVGANWYGSYEGAAFLWFGTSGALPYGDPTNADWSVLPDQSGAQYGRAVCGTGDVNGDGFGDIAVGAPYHDNGHSNEGGVFVYHGSETGPSATHDWFRDTDSASSGFGMRLDGAGDVNGDGFSDLIVGAPLYDHYLEDEGLAFIYDGSTDGLTLGAPWWYGESNQAGAEYGSSVSTAGDVNGDGYGDWIVGASYYDYTNTDQGGAFVYHGGSSAPPSGTTDNAEFAGSWPEDYAHTGASVSTAGDVNGDGYDDIVVGVPHANGGPGYDVGAAYMYYGSDAGIATTSGFWLVVGDQEYGYFGSQVDYAGDVNGDGFGDVLVSATGYDWSVSDEGASWLFYGGGGRQLPRLARQMQPDFSGPVAALGRSDEQNAIGLSLYGRSAAGLTAVKGVYEVKPQGVPFDGVGTQIDATWSPLGAPDAWGAWNELSAVVGGLDADTAYRWRVRAKSRNPLFPTTPWLTLPANPVTHWDFRTGGGGTGVGDTPAPTALALTNHPNPFNPATTLAYTLDRRSPVRLTVYDASGRLLRVLEEGTRDAGTHQAIWDGRDDEGRPLPSGVYFARIAADDRSGARKLILMK